MGPESPNTWGSTAYQSSVKLFATTTAYEEISDVGIGSPNVLCVFEKQSYLAADLTGADVTAAVLDTYEHMFGTPDLHPEGYDVVTDLLIGIGVENCKSSFLASTTAELDIMIIAEPKKITQRDLTQMLTQASDL
jgi:hypothetical protein